MCARKDAAMAAVVCGASDEDEDDDGGAEGGGSPAPPPPADPFDPHLAKSVTRQVQISGPSEWKHLVCGVDSLDVGLYVEWDAYWQPILKSLDAGKAAAVGTKGVRWGRSVIKHVLIYPSGKPPMYA